MNLKVSCHLDFRSDANIPLLFVLRPQSGYAQTVIEESFTLTPQVALTEYVDVYGNFCQRLVSPIGDFRISSEATVQTSDVIDVNFDADSVAIDQLPEYTLMYLLPSRYCESDKFAEMAEEITLNSPTGYAKVEAIRIWVKNNITYSYGYSNSSSSACDINASRIGVCRDFSHLCIALCRSISIPARMVVGYLNALEPMDLHAWFEVYLANKWYTFDATQDAPRGNRVVLAYGRDASDVAFATQFGPIELINMQVNVEQSTTV